MSIRNLFIGERLFCWGCEFDLCDFPPAVRVYFIAKPIAHHVDDVAIGALHLFFLVDPDAAVLLREKCDECVDGWYDLIQILVISFFDKCVAHGANILIWRLKKQSPSFLHKLPEPLHHSLHTLARCRTTLPNIYTLDFNIFRLVRLHPFFRLVVERRVV